MADQQPFLARATAKLKRFSGRPESSRTITDQEFIEDVRKAHASIYESLSRAVNSEAEFFNAVVTLALVEDDEYVRTPATFRKFLSLIRWDTTHKIKEYQRKLNRDLMLIPSIEALRLTPKLESAEAGSWELEYELGPVELHYGNPQAFISLTEATFTNATKTLTKTGAFAAYTFATGDIVDIVSGTGVTPGRYTVASRVDDNSITLTADIGGTNPTDIVADLYKVDSIKFAASPTMGQLYPVNDYYVGCTIYIVSGDGIGQSAQVSGFTGSTLVADVRPKWTTVPEKASVYEIRPLVPGRPGQFDDLILWRAALTYRRIDHDSTQEELSAQREAKNMLGEATSMISDVDATGGPKTRTKRGHISHQIWDR